jgi:hypothetical protein
MSTICTSNLTSGFIDLATYDEQEKYMYGGDDATAYFVRETRKSTWFTQVPVCLSRASGQPQFGQEWSVSISRAGDYLLQTWLRVTIPEVQLTDNAYGTGKRLRWTRNLMHNLIAECCITFNDLVAARFDSYHLDFWSAFTVPAGKRNGYNNMIGNTDALVNPTYLANVPIESFTLNLPLPFFYSRDSGVALPTAAIPYNDMRINFVFRDWSQLLLTYDENAGAGVNPNACALASELEGGAPVISATQVWANYAIVSNEERKRMACAPRDILIEQVQTSPLQSFNPGTNPNPSFDIRFSHAIKVLFFAAVNKTTSCDWSNYTTASPDFNTAYELVPEGAGDPIVSTSLVYENTQRLASMGSDYFSLVQPYYHAPVIPSETGYHMYSYSLDFICLDPMGSTNYGKLTNVSILPSASEDAIVAAAGGGQPGSGTDFDNTFQFVTTAVNNNIIRISGGALGQNGRPRTGSCQYSCMDTILDKQCKPCPNQKTVFGYNCLVSAL